MSKVARLPQVDVRNGTVEMAHGAGGRTMTKLVEDLFIRYFDNELLRQQNDQAMFAVPAGRMVMATDAHVISPIFFPGGDIGSLSVHGTINDVAMAGATPMYLAAAFVLEEGFPLVDLERIVASMAQAAKAAGVAIVTGDTKVVERGNADGIYITTTGVGVVPDGVNISADAARPGDKVLLSGAIGNHGMAILSCRENLEFATTIKSDSAALHTLVQSMLACSNSIKCLRDATRGGLAAVLNEWAQQSAVGFHIEEAAIPIHTEVASACELLGLDPLYVANEGKLVAVVAAEEADKVLAAMRAHPLGREASIIGEVTADAHHFVSMQTRYGGTRMVDWLAAEQLPRIC
jgi:hydrogenase expression/formation protein HypE